MDQIRVEWDCYDEVTTSWEDTVPMTSQYTYVFDELEEEVHA